MKLKILSLGVSFCVSTAIAFGQDNTVASGEQASGSGGTADYSIGQVSFISLEGEEGNLNLGVQQPYEFYEVGGFTEEIELWGAVYPTPASGDVNLSLENQEMENLSFSLYSTNGQLIIEEKIRGPETSIPMEILPNGVYFLMVKNEGYSLREFKIIKN